MKIKKHKSKRVVISKKGCETSKISKKEQSDFIEGCIGLMFGSSDKLQQYTNKWLQS